MERPYWHSYIRVSQAIPQLRTWYWLVILLVQHLRMTFSYSSYVYWLNEVLINQNTCSCDQGPLSLHAQVNSSCRAMDSTPKNPRRTTLEAAHLSAHSSQPNSMWCMEVYWGSKSSSHNGGSLQTLEHAGHRSLRGNVYLSSLIKFGNISISQCAESCSQICSD